MYFPGSAVEEIPSFSMSGWCGDGARTEMDSAAALEEQRMVFLLRLGIDTL